MKQENILSQANKSAEDMLNMSQQKQTNQRENQKQLHIPVIDIRIAWRSDRLFCDRKPGYQGASCRKRSGEISMLEICQ